MLVLEGCDSLVGHPNNFGISAPKLIRLKLSRCSNLKTLPNSIGLLAHLVVLDLSGCISLTCLWENNATIEVKELLFANALVIYKVHLDLMSTFPTL